MTIKSNLMILMTILLLNSCGNNEKALVEKCFSSYKTSILNEKGSEAVNFVTQGTIDQYSEFIDWCKHYDKAQIEGLSLMNRFMVILIKHRAPKEKILSSDGKELFIYAVNQGWVGKDGVMKADIADVSITADRATAGLLVNGVKAPFSYHFIKEGGEWRLNLVKVMQDSNVLIKKMLKLQNMSENEFIFTSAESVSGKKVQDSVWEPMVKK